MSKYDTYYKQINIILMKLILPKHEDCVGTVNKNKS